MARRKQAKAEDRKTIAVDYTFAPWFAVSCTVPALSGIMGIGETPLKALVHMRGEIRRRFPKETTTIIETITNPDFVAGWKMPDAF